MSKSHIKIYWANLKKINKIINPDSNKVPLPIRHFYGELPATYMEKIDEVINDPDLIKELWAAYEKGDLKYYPIVNHTLVNQALEHALNNQPPTNPPISSPEKGTAWIEIEERLDDLIDRTRTLDPNITNTLLHLRRLVGKHILT